LSAEFLAGFANDVDLVGRQSQLFVDADVFAGAVSRYILQVRLYTSMGKT
jgi:hypothetical protein